MANSTASPAIPMTSVVAFTERLLEVYAYGSQFTRNMVALKQKLKAKL